MKKALITGITGFAGSHLADYLLGKGYKVSGTYLTDDSRQNLPQEEKCSLHKLNLLDEKNTFDLVQDEKPEYIFHLAALPVTRDSSNNPKETFINNICAQINLLEAVKKIGLTDSRILVVSSAEVYGLVAPENIPIDEDTPFNPTNPYSVSKIAQDYLGLQYFLSDKLKTIRVRPFNHIGPRQSPMFVVSAFAKRIVEIEKGHEKIMKVGNLHSKRDFTDVRDMVKAYLLAIEKGREGEVYNIGSGVSYEISKILQMLLGLSNAQIKTEEDSSLITSSDSPERTCDFSKFNSLTGWKPEIPIEKTLVDTLDYRRSKI